ncbi:MAG: treS [Paucimonas sp.]|nr:treS [Paucimonas sp.]
MANVSQSSQAVELDLSAFESLVPVEMLGGAAFPPIGKLPYLLTLPPYGFYWFLLTSKEKMPAWHTPAPEVLPEYSTLVLREGLADILQEPRRSVLEKEALPAYLPKRRWYAAKLDKLNSVKISAATLLPAYEPRPYKVPAMLTELEVDTSAGPQRYLMPLGYIREEDASTALPHQFALARMRRGRAVGYLTDGFVIDSFTYVVLDLLRARAVLPSEDGEVRFSATEAFDQMNLELEPEIRRMSAEQSNSSLVISGKIVLKVIRRITPGIHPEAEMSRYLTSRGFANTPALLGEVTRIGADGMPHTLIVLQQFIDNQGDAWQWTLDTISRAIQNDAMPEPDGGPELVADIFEPTAELNQLAERLGHRLGELHVTLASPTDDPDFSTAQAGEEDLRAWVEGAKRQLDEACRILKSKDDWSNDADRERAAYLLQNQELLNRTIAELAVGGSGRLISRIHGDFHLGQVLVAQGDVFIVDFEGEPVKTLEQRRAKSSPLRDVAGLLRSLDYAAAFSREAGPGDLTEAALNRKQLILDRFAPAMCKTFLCAYRDAVRMALPGLIAEDNDTLLDLFLIEKAAYEVCYEAANRPGWIAVPLAGLAAIADRFIASKEKGEQQ